MGTLRSRVLATMQNNNVFASMYRDRAILPIERKQLITSTPKKKVRDS